MPAANLTASEVPFHEEHLPSRFTRLKKTLGLDGRLWSAHSFKRLVTDLVLDRESEALTGRFIQKMYLKPGMKFVMFGDLQGAFHSFVRDLQELQRHGVIDDTFRILKPDHYIILNGDLVVRPALSDPEITQVFTKSGPSIVFVPAPPSMDPTVNAPAKLKVSSIEPPVRF